MSEDNKKKKLIIAIVFFVIVIVAFLISKYFYQFMLIQGESMAPTYKKYSLVLLDKTGNEYESGDVIAFRSDRLDGILVKRIVGVPGDCLYICNNKLYVNGRIYDGPGAYDYISYAGILSEELILASGEYFVLGDNVGESRDSRYSEIGYVREDSIIGRICFPAR